MSPSTNTRSGSTEKLTISTEATNIPASTLTLLTQSDLGPALKDMFTILNAKFDK